MIKIEKVTVYGWEAAIRGLRNPYNSWDRSDSVFDPEIKIGPNDLELMKRMNISPEQSKYRRMITVTADITAPIFWIAEHDTYKVATVRNSCSFMHKGISKPFNISDFSVQDSQIYYLLNPIEKKTDALIYPYETEEFRIYELPNGRKYKIFRNGKIVCCEFNVFDPNGRIRHFEEKEIKPSSTNYGYYEINIGGRCGERWQIHRLVATVWIDNPNFFETVNHINGNKGDNSVENLEWCSRNENIKKGFKNGLYDKNKLHFAYNSWKRHSVLVDPLVKLNIKNDKLIGMTRNELAKKYNLTVKQIDNITNIKSCENSDLFYLAYSWEKIIETLNVLRDEYIETKNDESFKAIRQLLPQGYNCHYTWQANYEVLAQIYRQRKHHKLDEWREFCKWIESLPYSELITEGRK